MTVKPVPEHISDERLAEVRRLASVEENDCLRDGARSAAQYHADVGSALTELQHRREAETGNSDLAKRLLAAADLLRDGVPVPNINGGLESNLRLAASALAASPSSALDALRSIAVGKLTASDAAYVARTTLSALGEHP